jgi:hypothetical protein
MKKEIFFGAGLTILLSSLASAQDFFGLDLQRSSEQLIGLIQDIFGPIFMVLLGVGSVDQHFFERILVLVLLFVMILTALKKAEMFKKNYYVALIVSAAVSLIGARFISEFGLIEGILLPYGALAVALSVFIPLFVFFFFIHLSLGDSPLGRKLAWILFGVVFLGLFLFRNDDLGEMKNIYLIGMLVLVILFIFDNKIHEYFGINEGRRARKKIFDDHIAQIDRDLSYYIRSGADTKEVRERIEDMHRRRKELVRERARW